MSQFGTPSGSDAPSITAAQAKVVFVPDMDSLDAALQEVEKKYGEVIERVRDKAKAAIQEVFDETFDKLDKLSDGLQVAAAASAQSQPDTTDAPPLQADQVLMKLTELAETAVRIEANTDGILEGVTTLTEKE